MIGSLLQELVAFAESSEHVNPPNFAVTTLHWQLNLDLDGRPRAELAPLSSTELTKGGKTREIRGSKRATPRTTRTRGILPFLGPDGIGYVLGWGLDAEEEAAQAPRHAAYVELHREWARHVDEHDDPLPTAFLRFLEHHVDEVRRPESWTAKDNLLITIDGLNLHESPTAAAFWSARVSASKSSGAEGLCLVCGQRGRLVKTLPQTVPGRLVPQGQTSGVAPVSINEAVYGYDLQKSLEHVPICELCAYAIPAALTALLDDPIRSKRHDKTTTTWWVRGESSVEDELDLLDMPDAPTVRALMDSVESGRLADSGDDLSQFNSLIVSGNSSRLIVRRWHRVPVDEIRANLAAWFRDSRIVPHWPDGHEFQKLRKLASCTGRWQQAYPFPGAKGGRHPADVVECLTACAFERLPVPPHLIAHLIQRIRSDRRIDDPRAALLRLALVRSPHRKENIMPGLDPENTSPCYVAGRLFAAYDDLQRSASGGHLNATFADKHLAGAISSPRLALTAGAKQSAAWLSKLGRDRPGLAVNTRKKIDEIMELLGPDDYLPARATLDEEALFVLGFHHQRADLVRGRRGVKPTPVGDPDDAGHEGDDLEPGSLSAEGTSGVLHDS